MYDMIMWIISDSGKNRLLWIGNGGKFPYSSVVEMNDWKGNKWTRDGIIMVFNWENSSQHTSSLTTQEDSIEFLVTYFV